MSNLMTPRFCSSSRIARRAVRAGLVGLAALVTCAAALEACSVGNGDPIPDPVYDAQALDVATGDPTPGTPADAASKPDAAKSDAAPPADAAADAPGPNTGPVLINELYIDTILDGDGAEFVELRAAPGTPVDDLKLRIVYANGLVKYEVSAGNAGDKVDANGLWVVGGANTFKLNVGGHVDHLVNLASWGLDATGAVQLVRGATLLDVVGYNADPDAGALPPLATPPTATAEGRLARVPDNSGASGSTKRKTLGRTMGAPDTNDNAFDFCTMEASPGLAQQKACQ
jgi:hypothetical protein